jgi:hypothetical protein
MTTKQKFSTAPIAWTSSDFQAWFFPMKFNKKAKLAKIISQKLPRVMTSQEILAELKPSEISIEELYATLKTLDHSVLLLAYCKDKDAIPRLVSAYWCGDNAGWSVYAYDASNSSQWDDSRQLFSRDSRSTKTLGSSDTRTLCPCEPRISALESEMAKLKKLINF